MEEFTIIAPEYFEVVNSINTVWVALCAALIFFMEAGFAILEAGFNPVADALVVTLTATVAAASSANGVANAAVVAATAALTVAKTAETAAC